MVTSYDRSDEDGRGGSDFYVRVIFLLQLIGSVGLKSEVADGLLSRPARQNAADVAFPNRVPAATNRAAFRRQREGADLSGQGGGHVSTQPSVFRRHSAGALRE